jgi:Fe2+ transport system protein FeoA
MVVSLVLSGCGSGPLLGPDESGIGRAPPSGTDTGTADSVTPVEQYASCVSLRSVQERRNETSTRVRIIRPRDRRFRSNGSQRLSVFGIVRGPTAASVDGVAIAVDGERRQIAGLEREPDTGNASFYVFVNHSVGPVTVAVTPQVRTDEGYQRAENMSRDIRHLDGDGLRDVDECLGTYTNPLDPDSDSLATVANESGNGVDDFAENYDGDQLSTERELLLGVDENTSVVLSEHSLFGTDPTAIDTDGDGVTDGWEVLLLGTDPQNPDSDGDGTPDGREDSDGNGTPDGKEFGEPPVYASPTSTSS